MRDGVSEPLGGETSSMICASSSYKRHAQDKKSCFKNRPDEITSGSSGSETSAIGSGEVREIREGNLRIVVLNCQSIVRKWIKLSNIIEIYSPDIIIGVESWLRPDISDGEIFPKKFTVYRRDRVGTSGGGVFIIVREGLSSYENFNDDEFEILGG